MVVAAERPSTTGARMESGRTRREGEGLERYVERMADEEKRSWEEREEKTTRSL